MIQAGVYGVYIPGCDFHGRLFWQTTQGTLVFLGLKYFLHRNTAQSSLPVRVEPFLGFLGPNIVNLFVWHVGATQQTLRAIGTDVFAAHLIFISSVNGTLVECSSFITTTIE